MATKNRANVVKAKVKGIRMIVDTDTNEVLEANDWGRVSRFAHKQEHGFYISDYLKAEKELPDDADRFAICWEE
jgi:hypothetical protein